ncbi:pyridoxamine 5'-phosphate oxidase family protein [Curvibacter sp. CHRR-16]|uniref:pyridoxamine 5'-phosphate oxidase family protein n=1 Tax=Curvibacter sp. CHRR-16 TaxID=2835872 RepID=UPI001BD9BAC4|nr:pyridoxamine 5'-phosphate oxidase family protein [Curvibacter sp. CHRR-16]MBT0570289.1 pyridoxamine 5'-phosphate oxidase family protein [Curvibacter sp. CHRR-16]
MSTTTTSSSSPALPPSDRTRIRRVAENACYDRDTLYAIVDAAYVCHVAFADDKGTHCIPTACWREGDHLYIHGSNGGRLIKLLGKGVQACVTITHIDGLVLARSAFNHSMNYRSAMVYGRFEAVAEEGKAPALDAFMHHIAPGREHHARPGNAKELAATTVMRISLNEAACKVRSGGPNDDEEDMHLSVWAGVLPLVQQHGAPVPDVHNPQPAPDYVQQWSTAHSAP